MGFFGLVQKSHLGNKLDGLDPVHLFSHACVSQVA